ncbi:hypothetical protein HDV57DRAFT_160810 [Trichoderma longibrachiatum]
MAPVLRKRKAAEEPKPEEVAKPTEAVTPAEKSTKGKRKAAEQSTPVSSKKQKSTKKTVAESKTPKSQKAEAKTDKKEKEEAKKDEKKEAKEEKKEKKQKKETKKETKKEKKQDEKKDDVIDMEGDSDSEGQEDDENIQALAGNIDPEDETAVNEEEFQPGQDVGKIPKVSKDVEKSVKASKEEPGVVYIGRIPHGFYEYEMKQYLSQFGPISRLRLSRNKKTGASKHFAFVEFTEASTAEIVSKTMDNYLLFGHILKCKVLSKEQVHEDLFKGANRRFKKVPWNKMAGIQLEKPRTESAWEAKVARERNNRAKKAAKLKELGYDFEAPELKDVPAPAAVENGDEAKAVEASEVKAIEAAPEAAPEAVPEVAQEEEKPAEEPQEVKTPKKASRTKSKATATPKETPQAKATRSTRSTRAKKADA